MRVKRETKNEIRIKHKGVVSVLTRNEKTGIWTIESAGNFWGVCETREEAISHAMYMSD